MSLSLQNSTRRGVPVSVVQYNAQPLWQTFFSPGILWWLWCVRRMDVTLRRRREQCDPLEYLSVHECAK